MFFKISQCSQENTYAGISFFKKVADKKGFLGSLYLRFILYVYNINAHSLMSPLQFYLTLISFPDYCTKKYIFLLRISSVNMTKFAISCWFKYIYWRNPQWETSFFVSWIDIFQEISGSNLITRKKLFLHGSFLLVLQSIKSRIRLETYWGWKSSWK